MNFRTYADLNDTILKNLEKIPSDIDIIVGIPRSGMLVANIIALYLNLPLTDIESFLGGNIYSAGKTRERQWIRTIDDARSILLVDDSVDTGRSLMEAKELLRGINCYEKIITCVAFVTPKSVNYPDVYFDICDGPRMFEWNYLHHTHLGRACFDLDGVLCRDPSEEENDDGDNYLNFIKNVQPKVIPTFKIACIVTARLEKYRDETVTWLKNNGIKYEELVMSPFRTKEERIKSGSHGEFKAQIYKTHKDCWIFVESCEWQATQISELTGKAVFCIENHHFYQEGIKAKIEEKISLKKNSLEYKLKNRLYNKFTWIKQKLKK